MSIGIGLRWQRVSTMLRRAVNYPLFWIKARHKGLLTPEFQAVFQAMDYAPSSVEFVEACQAGLLHDFDLAESSVVFDVGAWQGDFALEMHERHKCRIHAFEPHPFAFADMAARLAPHPLITCHRFGLAAQEREVELTDLGIGSSIYAASPGYVDAPKVIVPLKDIVATVSELGVAHIDVLKVNIEGAEYELLERALDSGLIDRCRYVMVQFHPWFPDARRRRAAIQRGLTKTHDKVWDYPFVWEKWLRR